MYPMLTNLHILSQVLTGCAVMGGVGALTICFTLLVVPAPVSVPVPA
jgi:hypothetical protein